MTPEDHQMLCTEIRREAVRILDSQDLSCSFEKLKCQQPGDIGGTILELAERFGRYVI